MSAYRLFEIVYEHYNGDERLIIDDINELIGNIGQCKFTNDLSNLVNDFAYDLNLCPLCGSHLVVLDSWKESRGEYQGSDSSEEQCLVGCENTSCSYIVE